MKKMYISRYCDNSPFQQLQPQLRYEGDTRRLSSPSWSGLSCPPFGQQWKCEVCSYAMCDIVWAGREGAWEVRHRGQSTKRQLFRKSERRQAKYFSEKFLLRSSYVKKMSKFFLELFRNFLIEKIFYRNYIRSTLNKKK